MNRETRRWRSARNPSGRHGDERIRTDKVAGHQASTMIDRLYPEIATVVLFVVALICMLALLYISLNWD